jgi:hypothetical protein
MKRSQEGLLRMDEKDTNHDRLISKEADREAVNAISRKYRFGPLFYVIAVVVAWINTPAFMVISFLLALFFAMAGRKARSQLSEKTDQAREMA